MAVCRWRFAWELQGSRAALLMRVKGPGWKQSIPHLRTKAVEGEHSGVKSRGRAPVCNRSRQPFFFWNENKISKDLQGDRRRTWCVAEWAAPSRTYACISMHFEGVPENAKHHGSAEAKGTNQRTWASHAGSNVTRKKKNLAQAPTTRPAGAAWQARRGRRESAARGRTRRQRRPTRPRAPGLP